MCLETFLFEIKDSSISPPLRPPRTYFVSLCKTKHSSAEVLISVALRGGGGGRLRGTPNFSFDKTSTFCVCLTPATACSESHPLCKTSIFSVTKTFDTTHVMVSALGSFQTLQTQWFERHARLAVFARRKYTLSATCSSGTTNPPTYCRCVLTVPSWRVYPP